MWIRRGSAICTCRCRVSWDAAKMDSRSCCESWNLRSRWSLCAEAARHEFSLQTCVTVHDSLPLRLEICTGKQERDLLWKSQVEVEGQAGVGGRNLRHVSRGVLVQLSDCGSGSRRLVAPCPGAHAATLHTNKARMYGGGCALPCSNSLSRTPRTDRPSPNNKPGATGIRASRCEKQLRHGELMPPKCRMS